MSGPFARARPWWPALACMALIWALSSLSQPPTIEVPFEDKGLHVIEYGALAVLTARGLAATLVPVSGLRLALYNITLGTCWGLADEIHQAYVPGRFSEASDVVADLLGAIVGTLGYLAVRRLRASRA